MKNASKAWNKHDIDQLISHYDPNFRTKDGMTIEQIRANLGEFWFRYNNAHISSIPTSIYICGNHASINILEETNASQNNDSFGPINFKAWIRGITILKKFGDEWKITQEKINTETIWKYHGLLADEVLRKGFVKLIVPDNVIAGENYIAKIEYDLPERIKALAFIDNTLLGEFDDEDSLNNLQESEEDFIRSEKQRMTEISRVLNNKSENGLRRLFKANQDGQGELVNAHIELIAFP